MVILHQHSAETYQKMMPLFAKNDCVCAVHLTRTPYEHHKNAIYRQSYYKKCCPI